MWINVDNKVDNFYGYHNIGNRVSIMKKYVYVVGEYWMVNIDSKNNIDGKKKNWFISDKNID